MLEVRHIYKSYGEKLVLHDVSLEVGEGEVVALMGPSGSGKTTLLHILLGLAPKDSGETVTSGNLIFGAVFQEDRLIPHLSSVKNIKLASGLDSEDVLRELEKMGIERESARKPASSLSGGMARRVAILRALLSDANMLVFDEPMKGLDDETRHITAKYIKENLKGRALLMVVHNREDAEYLSARIVEWDSPQEKSAK